MNKMKLLVVPLLSVAFLVSCGGNGPEPIDYEVTAEEFEDALSMKDVKFVQLSFSYDKTMGEIVVKHNESIYKASPNVFYVHGIMSNSDIDIESYVSKEADNYYLYSKEEGKFKKEETTAENFITPQMAPFNLSIFIKEFELTFDNFKYNSDTHEYILKDINAKVEIDTRFIFNNKKLVSYVNITKVEDIEESSNYVFTYNEETPDLPPVTIR